MDFDYRRFYYLSFFIILIILIFIEIGILYQEPVEKIIISVKGQIVSLNEEVECFADIDSDSYKINGVKLFGLDSIYSEINEKSFYLQEDRGFFVLDVGFEKNQDFEIKVSCFLLERNETIYRTIDSSFEGCSSFNSGKLILC